MIDNLINTFSLHGNWVDLVFIALILFFILVNKGFVETLIEAGGFIFSLIFSYKTYGMFAQLLMANFSLSRGLANASGYFIGWLVSELILSVMISLFVIKAVRQFIKHPLNRNLGFAAAIIQGIIISVFITSLIFALPVRGQIKNEILQSRVGPTLVNLSSSLESGFKGVFGDAVKETINFITIKPESSETVDLGFKLSSDKLVVDQDSEKVLLDLVNRERSQRGLKILTESDGLKKVAEDYARQMMENGFFAHTSLVDGSTPADRVTRAGIFFLVEGENLAFAPDVYIAHQGLMNSPGHRANILGGDYGKLGIGVIDGGVYGKMFVQEFTN